MYKSIQGLIQAALLIGIAYANYYFLKIYMPKIITMTHTAALSYIGLIGVLIYLFYSSNEKPQKQSSVKKFFDLLVVTAATYLLLIFGLKINLIYCLLISAIAGLAVIEKKLIIPYALLFLLGMPGLVYFEVSHAGIGFLYSLTLICILAASIGDYLVEAYNSFINSRIINKLNADQVPSSKLLAMATDLNPEMLDNAESMQALLFISSAHKLNQLELDKADTKDLFQKFIERVHDRIDGIEKKECEASSDENTTKPTINNFAKALSEICGNMDITTQNCLNEFLKTDELYKLSMDGNNNSGNQLHDVVDNIVAACNSRS